MPFVRKSSLTFVTLDLVLVQMVEGVTVERGLREESLCTIWKLAGKLSFAVLHQLVKFKTILLSVMNTADLADILLFACR